MKIQTSLLLTLFLLLGGATSAMAQEQQAFSLEQSIAYALKNRASLSAVRTQEAEARGRVGEIRAAGLPQINATVDVGDNFIQQQSFLPAEFFIRDPNDPNNPKPGTFVPVTFTPAYTGNLVVNGSQLLFDGTYLVGLKAAKTFTELSRKTTQQSEIEVAEQVSKAYYGVLVNRERMELLNQNLNRLDTLLSQTMAMYKNGVAEKLDVDRLRVSRNNLKVEKQKAERLLELNEGLFKFQMGLDQNQPILLTDKLAEVQAEIAQAVPADFDYSNRIEYSILETQRDLANFELRGIRAGYMPRLLANARYGYNAASNDFSDLANSSRWLNFGYVGVQLQVPIFDGLRRHYQMQQAKARIESTRYGFDALRQGIDMELKQAFVEVVNSLEVIASQQENMELAKEIARVAKIKFQEGVGSNLEVVTAETELRQAQTNYYAALYDALIARVTLGKATGTLLTK